MEVKVFDRFLDNIKLQKSNLAAWFDAAPKNKLAVNLGGTDQSAVEERLEVIENSIEKSKDGTLGICEVCHGYVDTELLEVDYTACVCLDHFTEEERRSLEYELELAQMFQHRLLDHRGLQIPGVDVAAFSRPAQIIGGDFFDIFSLPDGAYVLVIADIAGHGVSASLYMSSLQTALRAISPTTSSPTEIVEKIQHLYSHNIHFPTFATLFFAIFDPSSSRLTYINAGHNPPLLLCRYSPSEVNTTWLQPTGPAIALVEEPSFDAKSVALHPGDLLLLYTDGVTEAMNQQEFFGRDRLAASAQAAIDLPARSLLDSLWQTLASYTQGYPLADDTTMVVFKLNE